MKLGVVCCLLLLIIATLGCVADEAEAEAGDQVKAQRFTVVGEQELGYGNYIRVVHDNELNVTLYQSASGYGYASITAIPDKDL